MMNEEEMLNRAGMPSRKISDLTAIGTINDLNLKPNNTMQKEQEFGDLAQYIPESPLYVKGVVEDWEEGLGRARFGDNYNPKKADIA